MSETLTTIPSSFTAKTTVKYTRSLADYPANDGWTLTLYLAGKGVLNAGNGVAAVANGAAFDVTLTATQTDLAAGTYAYEERVTKGSEEYVVGSGYIEIVAKLVGVQALAAQAQAEKDLEVVTAAIAGRLTSDMQAYQIAGRAVTKIPIDDLYRIKARLQADLWKLRNPGRLGGTVKVEFTGTSRETT